jgi:hypothetical protein
LKKDASTTADTNYSTASQNLKDAQGELGKKTQARIDAEVQKRLTSTKASKISEDSVEDILDKAKASEATLPNNNESSSKPSQSLMQKFADAFKKENIIIS